MLETKFFLPLKCLSNYLLTIITVKLRFLSSLVNYVLVNGDRESWEGQSIASTKRVGVGVIFLEGVDGVVCHVHLDSIAPVIVHVGHIYQHLTHRSLNECSVTCEIVNRFDECKKILI